jgi:carbamoyl-phosphate synthase large subunit
VLNTVAGAKAIEDSFDIRRTALMGSIPYYTTLSGILAAVEAIGALASGDLEVAPLQSYFKKAS